MTSKITLAAAIALAAIIAIPGASYAASKKSATDPASCTGGGCTAQNPDRVTQPCNGASCYKKTRKHKAAAPAASEKSDTPK
jgi:hypothetical protein